MREYTKRSLSNGLQYITTPLKGTKAVTVLILLGVGSRYETQTNNGVSHFVEHLLFKGTKKRPTSLDITKELDAVGAEYNAFTSKDYTGYYIKVASEKIELAFEVLSDMIFNSTFDGREIEKERGVIVEEINMYDDNPRMSLGDLLDQTVYKGHALGRSIAGPKKVIKKISRAGIVSYKEKFYSPGNMVVSIAGKCSDEQVSKLVKKYFSAKVSKKSKNKFDNYKIGQTGPRIRIKHKNSEQVQLGIGFPAYSYTDKRLPALYVLSTILGGNMSSRLFMKVREEHGLCYFIRTSADPYQDTGSFVVQAGLDKRRVKEAITLILQELGKVKQDSISDKELKSAKDYIKGKLVLSLEDSENIADWYAKQYTLTGKLLTPQERIKKIMAVKKEEVVAVANEIFLSSKINLVLIGPFNDSKEFKKILTV